MDRLAQMTQKVHSLFELADQLYGLNLRQTAIRFDLRGMKAGKACCRICQRTFTRKYSVHFNQQVIQGSEFDDVLQNATAHEVAHIVCFMNPSLGRDHDQGWKRVCVALGGNGSIYHSYKTTYSGGNYHYTTSTGQEVVISAHRHTKVQKGHKYRFKAKGWIDRSCNWRKQIIPGIDVSGNTTTKIPSQKDGSYAARIREWIRTHKPQGASQSDIIQKAVAAGMRLSSARSAVLTFWDKV
jgi:predicted SprT family Zn-dependent metalloprotease